MMNTLIDNVGEIFTHKISPATNVWITEFIKIDDEDSSKSIESYTVEAAINTHCNFIKELA